MVTFGIIGLGNQGTSYLVDLFEGGKINGGNIYHFGTRHLELTLDRQPTKSLYLRGFSGGEYLGGDWAEADDRPLAEEVLGSYLQLISDFSDLSYPSSNLSDEAVNAQRRGLRNGIPALSVHAAFDVP